jgi:hypothetical protein
VNWRDLTRELDQWSGKGRSATLWWRDDDAGQRNAPLDRLLALGRLWQVPVALSVVPDRVADDLPEAFSGTPARVLQHGWRHVNRAPPDARKCELIADHITEEALVAGRARLAALFGSLCLPVLVPPWNRIDEALLPRLGDLGYRGLSRYKPRQAATTSGLHQVNTHVDIIDWRSGRRFRGEPETLQVLVEHLQARRQSTVDPGEPTGLLTHHLDHDEACWAFIDRLFDRTRGHPAVRWLGADEIFPADAKNRADLDNPSPRPPPRGERGRGS